MLRRDAALARPAAKQDGLATREQLRAAGLTDRQIDIRIDAGVVQSVHPGVLHHAATPFTPRTRLHAAVLACGPTAAASHRSAGVQHAYDGIRRVRPEITVCDTTKPRLRDGTVHRTDTLEPIDLCVVDGIRTTAPARTLLDLGAVVPFEVVEHAVQVAIIEKKVTVKDLIAVLDRLGKPGRRGTASLRAVVRHSIPDERLATILEHDLHELIKLANVPSPELQYRLVCADGREVYLDNAWPELRLTIEGDGHRWHATRKQLERDLARRRSITASGWTHYSYGFGDVHDRKLATLAEIRSLFVAFAT